MKALWQDSRAKVIDRVVKEHDFELYAERNNFGVICVYRRGKRFVPFMISKDANYYGVTDSPQFVLALTHNWLTNGKPLEWGAEPIIKRIKAHDIWCNEKLFADLEEQDDKRSASKDKDFSNKTEAFLHDAHSSFKKGWNDIRVCNMDKTEKRRRNKEESINQKLK